MSIFIGKIKKKYFLAISFLVFNSLIFYQGCFTRMIVGPMSGRALRRSKPIINDTITSIVPKTIDPQIIEKALYGLHESNMQTFSTNTITEIRDKLSTEGKAIVYDKAAYYYGTFVTTENNDFVFYLDTGAPYRYDFDIKDGKLKTRYKVYYDSENKTWRLEEQKSIVEYNKSKEKQPISPKKPIKKDTVKKKKPVQIRKNTTGEESTSEKTLIDDLAKGSIVITSVPANAEIYVDGAFVGTTSEKPITLSAKTYTLELKKAGYKPWKRNVKILKDNTMRINIELEKNDG